MEQDTIVSITSQSAATDQLTALLKERAGELLAMAVDAEVQELLTRYADLRSASGHAGVVRNGYLPEREILTGIGPVRKLPSLKDN